MSTIKAEVCFIDEVMPHPNADRLELARVKGWNVVVGKNQFKAGEPCVYVPIDACLPEGLETKIFGPLTDTTKIRPSNGRIRTIKIRGAISQGLVVTLYQVGLSGKIFMEGDDVTELLGIKKYEPAPPPWEGFVVGRRQKRQKVENPNFHKYTSIENQKNHTKLFDPEDEVVISEKVHGSSFRAAWLPRIPRTFFQKILSKLGLLSGHEFVVGSHNTERKPGDGSVYSNAAINCDLKNLLRKGEAVYGEIFGPNIQKGYGYGVAPGETDVVFFDIKVGDKYLDYDDFYRRCREMGLDTAPVVFRGKFKDADLAKLSSGPSVLCPDQPVREGVVIRTLKERVSHHGRHLLKRINDTYLLKDQTEYH